MYSGIENLETKTINKDFMWVKPKKEYLSLSPLEVALSCATNTIIKNPKYDYPFTVRSVNKAIKKHCDVLKIEKCNSSYSKIVKSLLNKKAILLFKDYVAYTEDKCLFSYVDVSDDKVIAAWILSKHKKGGKRNVKESN